MPGRPWGEKKFALTREEMASDRERRILEVTSELVAEHGYLGFTAEQLIRRAGVGMRTVRELFGDKRGCYMALLDCAAGAAERSCGEAFEAQRGRRVEKLTAATEALLELAAANPAVAQACLVEPFAAGPAAIERYRRALGGLEKVLQRGRAASDRPSRAAKTLEGELMAAVLLWLPTGGLGGEAERVAELIGALRVDGGERGGRSRSRAGERGRSERDCGPQLGPLPTGKHKLPREAVKLSQRERLLAGVASAAAAKGYPALTVSDVIGNSRVSRRVFYELFEDKQDCFLAAWEIVAAHLGQLVASAEGDPPRQVLAALTAVLDFLAAEPELARFCLVEVLAVGAVGVERYREGVGKLAAALRETGATNGSPTEGGEELLVGALAMTLSLRIATEGPERLPRLAPQLTSYLLGPRAE